MTPSPIDYQLIKRFLDRGEIAEMAAEYGISKQAAYRIMNGTTQKNFEFLDKCYQRAVERANKIKAYNETLQSTPQL
jgi:hypothetical protein